MRFNEDGYLNLKSKIENYAKNYKFAIYILENIKLSTKKDGTEYKNLILAINKNMLELKAKQYGCKWFSLSYDDDGFWLNYHIKDVKDSSFIYIPGVTKKEIENNIKKYIERNNNYLKREEIKLTQLEKLKNALSLFISNFNKDFTNEYEEHGRVSFSRAEIAELISNF